MHALGSTTPQGHGALASFRTPHLVLPASRTPSAPWFGDFGAQYPACIFPCPTLQVRPLDRPRMARGQSGLLRLSLYDSFIHYSTPVYPDAIPAGGLLHGGAFRCENQYSMPSQPGSEIILVIDDELAVLSLTQMMLVRYGYGVLVASSGKEALVSWIQPWTPIS